MGFPGGSVDKEIACNVGDLGSVPGLGRSPGGGHGNPLQHSHLENPHGDRSLAGYSSWGNKESDIAHIAELNSTISQLDIMNIYRLHNPTVADYPFFSSSYGTFTKIYFIWGQKVHLKKYKEYKSYNVCFQIIWN